MKKIAGLLIGVFALVSCQQEKMAYVDNDTLNSQYAPMQQNQQKLQQKQQEIQESMKDEIEEFREEAQDFQDNMDQMSKEERDKKQEKLQKKQQELQQKQQMKASTVQQENQQVSDSLKSEIHDKIEDYAKSHGYTYVLGSDDDNVLYAEDSKNITNDVLEKLNEGENSGGDNQNAEPVESDSTPVQGAGN